MAEQKTVELGLGQLEGARLLHRILRGNGQKRRRQPKRVRPMVTRRSCMASNSADCTLGEARLISSASNRLVKIGPRLTWNVPPAASKNFGADNVGRQQIDGELDAAELKIDGLRQGANQERFGQSRHALQEQVPAGQQGDHHPFDDYVLADDNFGNKVAYRGDHRVDARHPHVSCR